MDYLKDIVTKIKEDKCVLIIGPDIIDFGDKTFFEAMCEEFTSNPEYKNIIDSAPQYVFSNEELFQPISESYLGDLQNMMKDFYEKQSGFDIPLTQISQIPFKLIVSLMPDDRLKKIFEKQNMNFCYGNYPREGAVAPPVEKPSKNKPLIYNLLGDFNRTESIITFDDLFDFFSDIMGRKELPNEIQVALREAGLFLFLGVNFEKWYAQLLLRIITPKTDIKKNKYTLLRKESNNEVCTFIARRFNLKLFSTAPNDFLKELFEECGNQDLLKTVNTKIKAKVFISYSSQDKEVAKKIEEKLIENKIEVIRDEVSSHAGQKIVDFISNTINNVDAVIHLTSKSSLKSRWICKEIIGTIEAGKYFAPFYIDKSFRDKDNLYWEEVKSMIEDKLNEIGSKIANRGSGSINDLLLEREDWTFFKDNLINVKTELNRGNTKSLMPEDFDQNILQVIEYIIKHKKDA